MAVFDVPATRFQDAAPVSSEPVSWETFAQEYLDREDEYKYEWVNGHVVKTFRGMNQYQFHIFVNLQIHFFKLLAEEKVRGMLGSEVDTWLFPKVFRRPDMLWFSEMQMRRMAERENQIPAFVIEIISDHDNVDDLLDKLNHYRAAEVACVWLVSPRLEQIHIFAAGRVHEICSGDMICSAAPALPNFEIAAKDVFKKPESPA